MSRILILQLQEGKVIDCFTYCWTVFTICNNWFLKVLTVLIMFSSSVFNHTALSGRLSRGAFSWFHCETALIDVTDGQDCLERAVWKSRMHTAHTNLSTDLYLLTRFAFLADTVWTFTFQLLQRSRSQLQTVTFSRTSTLTTTQMKWGSLTSRGVTCWSMKWSLALETSAASRKESSRLIREETFWNKDCIKAVYLLYVHYLVVLLNSMASRSLLLQVRCSIWMFFSVSLQRPDWCGNQSAEEWEWEAGEGGNDEGGRDHVPAA